MSHTRMQVVSMRKHVARALPLAAALLAATATADPLSLDRAPLPEEQNAYSLWEKALPELRWPDRDLADALRQVANPATNLPPPEAVAKVRDWLRSKEAPLALISQGIARGAMRFPPPVEGAAFDTLGVSAYLDVARAKAASARLLAADGQPAASADELLELLSMGRIVADSDGPIIDYLVGCAMQIIGCKGIQGLVCGRDVPKPVLVSVQRRLGPGPVGDTALAQSFRIEYHRFFVPALRKGREHLERTWKPTTVTLDSILDVEKTLEVAKPFFLRLVVDAGQPWPTRDRNLESEAAKLSEDEDLFGLVLRGAGHPSGEDADRRRIEELAAQNPNIVGKELCAMALQGVAGARKASTNTKAQHELTRALVALERRRLQAGSWPEALEMLPAESLLADTPMDPFSGKPLCYDREKGLLWSVGPDETDDGGDPKKDIVVRLPTAPR